MLEIILPVIYFLLVYGFFSGVMMPRGWGYWHKTFIVSLYFLAGTLLGLFLFSFLPLQLLANMTIYELSAIFFLLIILAWRIISGGFSMEQDVERASDSKRRKESFKYVLAKSQDIIFQDVLQVIVLSALFFYTGSVSTTVI